MTFTLRRLWLAAAVLAVSTAQTVTYLGRPPSHVPPERTVPVSGRLRGASERTEARAAQTVRLNPHGPAAAPGWGWSPSRAPPRSATPLPLIDELSVILSESRQLLAEGRHRDGGERGGAAAPRSEPLRSAGGAATYRVTTLHTTRGPGDDTASVGPGSDAVSGTESLHQIHGDFSVHSQQKPVLDRPLSPLVDTGSRFWRGIEVTTRSNSGFRDGETKPHPYSDETQHISDYKPYHAYLPGISPAEVVPVTAAAILSSDTELSTIKHLGNVALSFASSSSHVSAGSKRSPVTTPSATRRPREPVSVAFTGRGSVTYTSRDGAAVAGEGGATGASRDNVPGRPGIDYPTFSQPPVTAFSCSGKVHGMYADYETRCQVWHFCHENGHHKFVCVTGTVFSPVSRTCDWWYNVDCHYDAFPPF